MAPLMIPDDVLLQDPLLQKRIAALAKCGISWTPPSLRPAPPTDEEPEDSPIVPALDALTRKAPKHPRKKTTVPDLPSEPESESEMMGDAYQDALAAAIKKRDAHLAQGSGVSRSEAAKLDDEAFADLAFTMGERATELEQFIPWRFLTRYAELYVGKRNTPTVEPYFEEAKLFEMQPWDIFYLYEPEALANTDPILFVRTAHFEALLRKINKKHNFALTIPDGGNEVKFARQFPQSAPRPRYLTRTTATSSYTQLIRSCPLPEAEDDLSKATEADREAFAVVLQRCKDSWSGGHGKGKESKARKKAMNRYDTRKAWGRASKRVQRWLGLREKAATVISIAKFTGQEEPAPKPNFDVDAPAPHAFDEDVVFVCFDAETDENSAQVVTEVGFAVLDTRDLKGVAPGKNAENWFKLIQARHLRIKEYLHIKNSKYVDGCPEKFQFGKSEVVGIDRVERVCTKILCPKDADGKPRKVVVIGHDIKQDIELLFGIDVDIYELPGLIDIVDNQRIQQHDVKYKDPQKLAVVLDALGIENWYLHNGGNDAVYTLQSLLAVAVRRRQKSLAEDAKLKTPPRPKPELGDVILDMGWSTGGEDTDGGRPPKLVDPYEHLKDPITGKKGISSLTIEDDES